MKLIAQDGGIAALAITVPDEVKPLKGYHLTGLLNAIRERYEFAKSPTLDDARTMGAKFQNGRFIVAGRAIAIGELGFFNDALSVTTTDTADSELVLADFFIWLKETFEFRDPITPPARLFQSDIVVKFDNDPSKAFGRLAAFLDYIQQQMTAESLTTKKHVRFSRIAFGTDPYGPGATPEFVVERRAGVPWDLQLYFSKAHMSTEHHIRALQLLDDLIAPKR